MFEVNRNNKIYKYDNNQNLISILDLETQKEKSIPNSEKKILTTDAAIEIWVEKKFGKIECKSYDHLGRLDWCVTETGEKINSPHGGDVILILRGSEGNEEAFFDEEERALTVGDNTYYFNNENKLVKREAEEIRKGTSYYFYDDKGEEIYNVISNSIDDFDEML